MSPELTNPAEVPVDVPPRLRMVTMRLARLLRQHSDLHDGLSQGMVSALVTIERYERVTLGRLAELERVRPPSMTRIVGKLEVQELVLRTVDPTDQRVVRVSLTPQAHDLLAKLRMRRNEYLAGRLAELSSEELSSLQRALPVLERLAGLQQ